MPLMPSPLSAVPNSLSRPAQPLGPMGGASFGGAPQGLGGIPPQQGPGGESSEPDLFQRVAMMITANPMWLQIFAGMGLREALEKTGKYVSKPHRSNEELSQQGFNVGMPGQTGVQDPAMMMRSIQPPGVPGLGPASMGGIRGV